MCGIQCIGHMGRGRYAELNFDDAEAVIKDQLESGDETVVATVPFGSYEEETEEYDAKLDPDHPQNKRLWEIVCAPDLVRALRFVEKKLAPREDREDSGGEDHVRWREDSEMLREVQEVLERLDKLPE